MSHGLRRRIPKCTGALAACVVAIGIGIPGKGHSQSLDELQRIIEQQQAQIDAQSRVLDKLREEMDILKQQAVEVAAGKPGDPAEVPGDLIRAKGGDKVAVKIYGQVNQALLVADDGDSTDYYTVDNDHSSSRIGILGDAKINEDLTVGARMEFEYQPNPSNVVNRENKEPGADSFDDRWVDAQLTSKRFGKLYIGKGDTASNGTSEVDLSGTAIIGYSGIQDMAGGILFYDENRDAVSGTDVGDVFSNFDGLSRRSRIRYDSPEFAGFGLSGSILSDGGDVALRYFAQWADWKFGAALAYADPQAISNSIEDQYNGSVSILHSSGISFTVAAGMRELEDSSRDDPMFYYGKVGYRSRFFQIGETFFSVDYMYSEDQARNGDEGMALGFQMVQDLPEWGSEYYLGYRWHELDRDGEDYGDINALMTGVRVKF